MSDVTQYFLHTFVEEFYMPLKQYTYLYKQKKGDRGFVIAVVMFGILMLTFVGMISISSTTVSVKSSGDYTKTIGLFNIAEVGLAKARPIAENSIDFDTLLATYDGTPIVSTTTFNDGTYTVEVTDNDDGDGDLTNDSDNIIILTSTAVNSNSGSLAIEVHLQKISDPIEFPDDPISGPSAAMLCGSEEADVRVWGAAKISGQDMEIPDLSTCSGSGCTGTPVFPLSGGHALAYESTIDLNIQSSLNIEGVVAGLGVSGVAALNVNLGAAANCSEWETLNNQIASLSCSASGVECFTGNTTTITNSDGNDCNNPKIYVINTTKPLMTIQSNTRICGIVLVASDTSLELAGNSTIVGTVFVMGSSTELTLDTTGTSDIFGKVIVNSIGTDSDNEIDIDGNASIYYSTEGMQMASQALSNAGAGGDASIITIAWREIY
ncbi:MAG: hypothetical protein KDK51_02805 [Deltaproteobacteria bacterium]|nr:hypothetical protein [Deltaproteobacteria bacterium]